MRERLQRALAGVARLGAGGARLAALVAALLASVLAQGFQVDDLWQRIFLRGDPRFGRVAKPWWDLFVFFDGDPARLRWMRGEGIVPWWADERARLAFCRPLSALTHAVDYALWPASPAAMHAQSLAWYVGVALVAAALYRRVLGAPAAALAALLYALDPAHAGVAAWIANRNALLAAFFGLLGVLLHDRGARGEARARWLSAPSLALALLSGESGVAAFGYLAAYALTLDGRPWRARAASLVPAAAAFALWAAAYHRGGYGTAHTGMYVDPGSSPLRFLAGLPSSMALLAASQWGSAPPEVALVAPSARGPLVAVAVAVVALSLAGLWRSLRAQPGARFLLLGGALALVPSCGTVPATRLLLLPGFGLLGLVAVALSELAEGPAQGSLARRVGLGWLGGWAGLTRLFVFPLLVPAFAWQMVAFFAPMERWASSFAPDDRALASQRLVVVNAPDTAFVGYTQLIRAARGETLARSLVTLGGGARALTLARLSRDEVEVRADGGFYLRDTELLTRDLHTPMAAGQRVALPGVDARVTRVTAAGVPDVARFTFTDGADGGGYRFVRWRGRALEPFALPAVGAAVTIDAQSVAQ